MVRSENGKVKARVSDIISGLSLAVLLGIGGAIYGFVRDVRADLMEAIRETRAEFRDHARRDTHYGQAARTADFEARIRNLERYLGEER